MMAARSFHLFSPRCRVSVCQEAGLPMAGVVVTMRPPPLPGRP
jgi:hypothetical protein